MRRRRYAAGRADTGTHSETERETERETHVADTLLNEGFVTKKKQETETRDKEGDRTGDTPQTYRKLRRKKKQETTFIIKK